jgi:RNA polymerase sigma-70 factor (ECF subfamily)
MRLEDLFAQHEQELGRFIAQLVHSRQLADDLVQETFLAAWRSRADLDQVRDPRAWLYGIARNRVLMYLRGWRRAIAAYERFVERDVPVPRARPMPMPSATSWRGRSHRMSAP